MPDTFDVEVAAARSEIRMLSETVAGLQEVLNEIREAQGLDRPLVCVECGLVSDDGAEGWRTYLTIDDEPAMYCPTCAREEFDDA